MLPWACHGLAYAGWPKASLNFAIATALAKLVIATKTSPVAALQWPTQNTHLGAQNPEHKQGALRSAPLDHNNINDSVSNCADELSR